MKSFWFFAKQSFMLLFLRRLRNFPMLLLLVVLFALMSAKASWVLGAPYLFWHDEFIQVGILALLAVGLFLEEWAFVAILLDTDENNPINLSIPGRKYSRISLMAGVKNHLEIESHWNSPTAPERELTEPPDGGRIVYSAAGGITSLSDDDQQKIYATIREIHSVATYTLAFIFGFVSAYVYQALNENLISFSGIGLVGFDLNGIDFLGPLLIGLGLMLMVYLMFLLRRSILYYSDPLIQFCKRAHTSIGYIPWAGKTIADWFFSEIIRDDSLFRSFHLIAFVKNLISILFLLVLCIVFWAGYRSESDPSVALIVCVVLAGVLSVYGWMVFQRRRLRYEFVIALLLVGCVVLFFRFQRIAKPVQLVIGERVSDNLPDSIEHALQQVRSAAIIQRASMPEYASNSYPNLDEVGKLVPVQAQNTIPESQLLRRWKNIASQSHLNSNGEVVARVEKPILVLVSNTGGGIKAQVWSTVVLNAIENLLSKPASDGSFTHFSRHVRMVTGASGGMVGAGYWVATLDPGFKCTTGKKPHVLFHRDSLANEAPTWLTTEDTLLRVAQDCLSRVARQGFFNDLLGTPWRLMGWRLPTRGEALEDSFVRLGNAFSTRFSDLGSREDLGELPTLVYTPAVANDGRRFLICNQQLEYLFYSCYSKNIPAEIDPDSPQDTESTGVYSWRVNYPSSEMTLATACRLSANFPIVVDSPTLIFKDPGETLSIMDAGYVDNHGVYPLAVWLKANQDWIRQETAGVLLLQIAASPLPRIDNTSVNSGPAPEVGGFVSTSFNKTLFHSDQILDQVAKLFNREDTDFFKVLTFTYDGEASLSWYLNEVERLSLIYPFLSDEQASDLFPNPVQHLGKPLQVGNHINDELITFTTKTTKESPLVSGKHRFRSKDFYLAEKLRAKMGRQLKRLEQWWQAKSQ